MKDSIVLKIILGIAGLLIIIPGAMSLFNPTGFTIRNGADISNDLALLNDYRGLGGMMIGTGIIAILGIIHSRMAFTSTVVVLVMYLTLALGRMVSLGIDGVPPEGNLVPATIVEFVVGLLAVFALVKYRDQGE